MEKSAECTKENLKTKKKYIFKMTKKLEYGPKNVLALKRLIYF